MELTASEYEGLVDAGTDLLVIAEPVGYDRDEVPHPAGAKFNPDDITSTLRQLRAEGKFWPLAAGVGRYVLLGDCGQLKTLFGWEYCGAYENRPQVCRNLAMGSQACLAFRVVQGVDKPDIKI